MPYLRGHRLAGLFEDVSHRPTARAITPRPRQIFQSKPISQQSAPMAPVALTGSGLPLRAVASAATAVISFRYGPSKPVSRAISNSRGVRGSIGL